MPAYRLAGPLHLPDASVVVGIHGSRWEARLIRPTTATDEHLLGSSDPEDFGCFYDRHVDVLLGWFARRTGDPETAAGLTAETFAAALAKRPHFRAREGPAVDWLHGLARAALERFQRGDGPGRTAARL